MHAGGDRWRIGTVPALQANDKRTVPARDQIPQRVRLQYAGAGDHMPSQNKADSAFWLQNYLGQKEDGRNLW